MYVVINPRGNPRQAEKAIRSIPPFSLISTTDGPNESIHTGVKGQLAFENGSSITPLWVCTSDGTGNWSALSWI